MTPTRACLLPLIFVMATAPVAFAEPSVSDMPASRTIGVGVTLSEAFAPRPTVDVELDWTSWSGALNDAVLYGGPSDRFRLSRPAPMAGSRLSKGHTSPFRQEGNKVLFDYMGEEFQEYLSVYVQDLINLAQGDAITRLPRDEQLAFWFNLHNMVLIRDVSARYPLREPSNLTGADGRPFHDSARIEINGHRLSLRDIREQIVYANWSDPRVIYGFFHGDLGSPSLLQSAFTGRTVWSQLDMNANEFTSSLRGAMPWGDELRVSRHYRDAAPFFFPDFDADLRAHLKTHASPEALEDIERSTAPLKIGRYHKRIADLAGGDVNTTRFGSGGAEVMRIEKATGIRSVTPSGARGDFLRERTEKFRRLKRRGLDGFVTIEDIETDEDQELGDAPVR